MVKLFRMRTLLIVLVVAVILYFSIKKIQSNLSFDYKFAGVDFSTLNIADLISGNLYTRLKILLIVTNANNFSITIKNLKASFYDADTNLFIGKTSDTNETQIVIQKNAVNQILENVDILLNLDTTPFLLKLKRKEPVNIRYVITGSIYNFPVTIDKIISL